MAPHVVLLNLHRHLLTAYAPRKHQFEPQVVKPVPKFTVTKTNDTKFEVEADTFQDAGHEGRWIDFGGRSANVWFPVLRVRAADVMKIERND